MKSPKLWDGPSPVGEALERALQKLDVPFLSASDGQGTTVRKKIGYSEITIERPETESVVEGWYTFGREGEFGTDEYEIRSSADGRGRFRKRAVISDAGRFIEPSQRYGSSLAFLYLGGGVAITSTEASSHTDQFNSSGFLTLTKTGRRTYDKNISVFNRWWFDVGLNPTIFPLGKSATVVAEGDGVVWSFVAVGKRLTYVETKVHELIRVQFYPVKKEGSKVYELSLGVGVRVGATIPQFLDTEALFLIAVVFCHPVSSDSLYSDHYPSPAIDSSVFGIAYKNSFAEGTPGELFQFAQNPDAVAAPGLFVTATEYYNLINNVYIYAPLAGIVFIPLGANLVVALNNAYYYDCTYEQDGALKYMQTDAGLETQKNLAVFTGFRTGPFSRAGTLTYPGGIGVVTAPVFFGSGAIVQAAGYVPTFKKGLWDATVAKTYEPETAGSALLIFFDVSPVGDISTAIRPLPWAAHRCGRLLAIDEETIGIPAYGENAAGEVGYYLFQSRADSENPIGVVWTVRATISQTAEEPPQYQGSPLREVVTLMNNYESVAQFRKDDFPASVTPGAPWRTNPLKKKPWE